MSCRATSQVLCVQVTRHKRTADNKQRQQIKEVERMFLINVLDAYCVVISPSSSSSAFAYVRAAGPDRHVCVNELTHTHEHTSAHECRWRLRIGGETNKLVDRSGKAVAFQWLVWCVCNSRRVLRTLLPLPSSSASTRSPGAPRSACRGVCAAQHTPEKEGTGEEVTSTHTLAHIHTSAGVQVLAYQPDCSIKSTKCGAQGDQQATREGRAPTA